MATRPSRKRATIIDVARASGVSRQTVSNVINSPDRVRPDTRARVEQEIDRLGYRPSSAARTMRSQRAGAVGVEINPRPGLSDVDHLVLTALTVAAPAHDAHIVPFADPRSFPAVAAYRDMSRRQLVDAFVFSDTHSGDPRPDWLLSAGLPFATFGRIYSHPELTSWVDVDGHAGLVEAVTHLRQAGYDTVAYLGWPLHLDDPAVAEDRFRGWSDATTELGCTGPEARTAQEIGAAVAAADQLLEQLGPGDAIACASDLLALGVTYAAGARGLRVGEDIGVVGFDGSLIADRHGLTSVAQPFTAIASRLLTLVHDQLAGDPPPEFGQLLTPSLVPGPSTDRTSRGTAYTPLPAPGNRR